MKEQLTDTMILENMTVNPNVPIILGVVGIVLALIIWRLLNKSPKYSADKRNYIVVLPFALFGFGTMLIGFVNFFKGNPTMDDFVVIKSEVVDRYRQKKLSDSRKSDATAKYRYYIVCEGFEDEFRITKYDYYNEYKVGDELYIIVDSNDYNDRKGKIYKADEYEYAGDKLVQ